MAKNKEIILEPAVSKDRLKEFIDRALKLGVELFYFEDTSELPELHGNAKSISPSDLGDVRLFSSFEEFLAAGGAAEPKALQVVLRERKDVDMALEAAKQGARYLIIDAPDWKIIPLENLIAEVSGKDVKLYVKTQAVEELKTLFGVLEKGVDGVVLRTKSIDDLSRALKLLAPFVGIKLVPAKVTDVKSVGLGERACVDTSSMLKVGEGMLVGSAAGFLFLVHNESIGSPFTSPRPFRVNAGGIHSYILIPDGKTKYLSELEAGDSVLVVNQDGSVREAVVGRVKIERRPLKLVKAEYEGEKGSILVQDAETIGFVSPDGKLLPVNELKLGDEILVRVEEVKGRHFGLEVDELVIER